MKLKLTVIGIVLLVLSGCASLVVPRDALRVSISSIQVHESTMLEQVYLVSLRIQNHSDKNIEIYGGGFDLEINGRDFGSGVSSSAANIPAYSDALIEVRMVSTIFGMLRVIQSLQAGGKPQLEYEISGKFSVKGYAGGIPFREQGELSMPTGPVGEGSQ